MSPSFNEGTPTHTHPQLPAGTHNTPHKKLSSRRMKTGPTMGN